MQLPGEIADELPVAQHEPAAGAVPHGAVNRVAGEASRQLPENPGGWKARDQNQGEGNERQRANPEAPARPQRLCSTTPALTMPDGPALSMVAESTRIPSCSDRRASQATTTSKGAFSRRTCRPPAPEGSLLVSAVPRPAARAALSTT